jgi:hypothetical protein
MLEAGAVTDDERADGLLAAAVDLITRVRDDDPRAVQRHLDALDPVEHRDITVLLAAMVPDDRTATELLAWYQHPPPTGRTT